MAKRTADRGAVQALLKRKRAKLKPADYGLDQPAGRGRRAVGPAQDQMDEILHWARGTYQGIESGRRANVPAEQLEALALLLGLTEYEWGNLWAVLRGEKPPYALNNCAGQEVSGEWLDAIRGISHPAYINDRSWNVLAWNDAVPGLFPGGVVPGNTMRWMLLDDAARGSTERGIEPVLTDWEDRWAPMIVPQLRSAVAALPHDKVLAELEADVRLDPRTAPIYDRFGHVLVHPDGAIRPFAHPVHGPGWLSLCTAEPLASPRAHLMIAVYRSGEQPARKAALRSLGAPACELHQERPLQAL